MTAVVKSLHMAAIWFHDAHLCRFPHQDPTPDFVYYTRESDGTMLLTLVNEDGDLIYLDEEVGAVYVLPMCCLGTRALECVLDTDSFRRG